MLLAILFPSLSMLLNGHILKALLCFILHLTLIGWIPANERQVQDEAQ